MVWIHGGGFFNGSGGTQMYGPQYLLDKDIILVTINYRLGTLGTLKRLNLLLRVLHITCHTHDGCPESI
jgi:carboxylesterase type B